MILGETARMAAGNLWSHKLRSILTVLGVVIGVSSVLAVVTLGKSFESSVISNFDSLDSRNVFVSETLKEGANRGPPRADSFGPIFTQRDAANLLGLPHAAGVVPSADVQTTALIHANSTYVFSTVKATTAQSDILRLRTERTVYASGRPFHDGAREVVLGASIAEGLTNLTGVPVTPGTTLLLRLPDGSESPATVSGILSRSDALFGSGNLNVFAPLDPYATATVRSPVTGATVHVYNALTVAADTSANTDSLRDAVRAYFDGNDSDARRLAPSQLTVQVATQGDITKAISSAFSTVTLFINAIAGVSLLVGAIGIANIMLVSVAERTREIGVMKAIGARDREVLAMFLLESTFIGLLGSIVGMALGIGLAALVVTSVFKVPLVVDPMSFLYAALIGIGVGIVAGYLPARRATRIRPIEALSHE